MSISIVDHELPYDSHNIYDVNFYDDQILTLVTHTPSIVDSWISEIERIHRRRLHHLVVGFDVEWRPNFHRNQDNPVATLQLCVGRRCLIFQLIHAPNIPRSLVNFLLNQNYTFVGVGIDKDVEKLEEDYNMRVGNTVDLRGLAAYCLEMVGLRNAGLKGLAREVLGLEISKPKSITMSRWDYQWLSAAQIQYACVDAFVSFEIGRMLNAATY
ncbi:hypothetical protein LWI28_001807 [Acer negundo]|uniref:3'-5' exonuclease domain-containing protein n=1 Tax=Acer negundo TaxID=4023 RepID=A0AAD5NHI6_ACENE|nr:hypothetical protein LWI28_001807 [Acer negundo]KAK4838818.1 hypothetical protein QYF36_016642 [Acer negundo]